MSAPSADVVNAYLAQGKIRLLAYDLAPDGSIVYTNGKALCLLRPDGHKEHLLNESLIEQVCFAAPA